MILHHPTSGLVLQDGAHALAMSDRSPGARGRKLGALSSGRLTDLTLLLVMAVVALGSGSITLLGETIRGALMMVAGVWGWAAFAAEERDARQRYEFGTGKLEQAGHLAIALAMAAVGLWLGGAALELAILGQSSATPFGLALAATVNAARTLRRGSLVWARSSADGDKSRPDRAPLIADAVTLAPLLIVQTTLTLAALATDPAIGRGADCLGGIFVGLLMTAMGAKMVWEAVVDLIDHPLPRKVDEAIARILFEQGVPPKDLLGIRCRRSGRHLFVELTLDPGEASSVEEVRQRLARVRHGLMGRLDGLDLAIRLQVPQAERRRAAGESGAWH